MKIYFLGICGTAMGNAALLARAAGHEVSGADTGIYPPMSTVLADAGITLHEGYDPERLASLELDLVVIGNSLSRGNPVIEWLLDTRAIRVTSLPALLHDTILSTRKNIVVCGTHGKTTTTALAAYLLRANGRDPGFLIGGVPLDPPTGNHLGTATDPFVIEGDEYDSAFFDKRSKFIHYAPHIAVLNNLEFDHADIFRDLADVQRTFSHLTRIVPRNGWVVLNGDDENLRALGPLTWTNVFRVGFGAENDVRIEHFAEDAQGVRFTLSWGGKKWGTVDWKLHGVFNARNAAMAATAAALALGGQEHLSLAPLAEFRGVKRRQEKLVERPGLIVIEDFGHHPTALAETLTSLRNRYPGTLLTAVFEPRSNTARTKALQSAFMRALAMADEVFIGAVNRSDKLKAEERFDAEEVIDHLELQGVPAATAPTNAGVFDKLHAATLAPFAPASTPAPTRPVPDAASEKPRLVVFFSNGSFDGIIDAYAQAAARK